MTTTRRSPTVVIFVEPIAISDAEATAASTVRSEALGVVGAEVLMTPVLRSHVFLVSWVGFWLFSPVSPENISRRELRERDAGRSHDGIGVLRSHVFLVSWVGFWLFSPVSPVSPENISRRELRERDAGRSHDGIGSVLELGRKGSTTLWVVNTSCFLKPSMSMATAQSVALNSPSAWISFDGAINSSPSAIC